MEQRDIGLLYNKEDLKLHRQYFEELCLLKGIQCIYKAPRKDKSYDLYGELESNYYEPELVGCIFEEHPTQWTMKKLGWNSELQTDLSIIHVPYDLKELQVGALFIVPSGIDGAEGRVFKVIRMSTTMMYPASVSCEIGPVFQSNYERGQLHDYSNSSFNLLDDSGEDDD